MVSIKSRKMILEYVINAKEKTWKKLIKGEE